MLSTVQRRKEKERNTEHDSGKKGDRKGEVESGRRWGGGRHRLGLGGMGILGPPLSKDLVNKTESPSAD